MSLVRTAIIPAALCTALFFPCKVARAVQQYSVQVLPARAFALNDLGQVAMNIQQGQDESGFPIDTIQIWQHGATTTLATGRCIYGRDMNNLGHVVGYYEIDHSHCVACLWTPAGRTDIAYGGYAAATAINDADYVVGRYRDYEDHTAFVWDGSTITDLITPGAVSSSAFDINNSNQVAGMVTYLVEDPDYSHYVGYSIRWDGTAATFLNEHGFYASAGAINNHGQIPGEQYLTDPPGSVL